MLKKIKFGLAVVALALVAVFGGNRASALNDYGLGVSPMKQTIILNAGEKFTGSFTVTNPANNAGDFEFVVKVSPFYATEDYNISYEKNGDYNQMVDWIKVGVTGGTLKPNSVKEIPFAIDVPKDAPAGGQYAAIIVQAKPVEKGDENGGVNINQTIGIAHTIFAEVAGTTYHDGAVTSIDLPGFMFGGKITGSASVQNTGNVHGKATYTLQVFPLFSDEEIYTNEENPDTALILPDRTLYRNTTWEETPMVGMFNVTYTVEYEGITAQVSKLVIVCPFWLLFIIIFVIVAIIVWLVYRAKTRKKSAKKSVDIA